MVKYTKRARVHSQKSEEGEKRDRDVNKEGGKRMEWNERQN